MDVSPDLIKPQFLYVKKICVSLTPGNLYGIKLCLFKLSKEGKINQLSSLFMYHTGCPKKMQDSDFLLKSVLDVRFDFSTCVSESKF